jgi:hypothetical protein
MASLGPFKNTRLGAYPLISLELLAFVGSEIGGAEEDRTPDLRIANATLSQLSYRPLLSWLKQGIGHVVQTGREFYHLSGRTATGVGIAYIQTLPRVRDEVTEGRAPVGL